MANGYNGWTAIAFVINCMLGSGINYMPAVFNNSGIVLGIGILFIVGCLTTFSIYALFRCCFKSEAFLDNVEYGGLGKLKYKHLGIVIEFTLLIASILSALGFQKYASELITIFISRFYSIESPSFTRCLNVVVLMATTLILTGLSMIQNLKRFKILSYLSVFCIFSLMVILTFLNISIPNLSSYTSVSETSSIDFNFILSFCILAMSVQANIPYLYTKLENITKSLLLFIAALSSFVGFMVYGLAGVLGSKLTGSSIGHNDIIKYFLDKNSALNLYIANNNDINPSFSNLLVGLILYQSLCAIVILISGFPLQLAPAVRFFKKYLPFKNANISSTHNIIVLILLTFLTLINMIPNLSLNLIFELLGPTAIGFLCYFFPFLLYYAYAEDKSKFKKMLALLIMLFSVIYSIYGVTCAIKKALHGSEYGGKKNNLIDFEYYAEQLNSTTIASPTIN